MPDTATATATATATVAAPQAQAATPPPAAPGASIFDIDCALSYQVNAPTDFLFQIHALNAMDQQVLSESLVITPPLPVHVFADPTVHHRFLRVHADAGLVEPKNGSYFAPARAGGGVGRGVWRTIRWQM